MRLYHLAVNILFAAALAVFVVTGLLNHVTTDRTYPVIECTEEAVSISVYDDNQDIFLEGVTAHDDKDGDLSDRVLVESVQKTPNSSQGSVTLAVVDNDGNVSKATRSLQYTDYRSPRFALERPLNFFIGDTVQIRDRLTAEDVIDGDVSENIKVITNGLTSYSEGTYPITVEVTNSLSDMATITLNVTINGDRNGPRIELSEYIVYIHVGDSFNPMSYVENVANGDKSAVTYEISNGEISEGQNTVTYTCTGADGKIGTVDLIVIAEG